MHKLMAKMTAPQASPGQQGGRMNLELLLLGDVPVSRLTDRAMLAEANGYTAVWMADERFYREVYTCLGRIAAHTGKGAHRTLCD